MQDHSHKLLFLGLSGFMTVAALYGSETMPALFASDDRPIAAASMFGGREVLAGGDFALEKAAKADGLKCTKGPTPKDVTCLRRAIASLDTGSGTSANP